MSPFERLYEPKYALELLRIAEGDLKSAMALNKLKEGRLENIFFLSEQAIEKALKAVLCIHQLPVPFSHDLGLLIGKIGAFAEVPQAQEIPNLTQYATTRRYEEGSYIPTKEECEGIVVLAQTVLIWAVDTCQAQG